MPDPKRRPASVRAPTRGEELPRFERLLADLSARLVNLPPREVDDAITDALRRIVLLLDVDRSQLIRFDQARADVLITHSWAVEGVARVPPKSVRDGFPWLIRRIRGGEVVVIARIDALPPEAAVDQASFRRAGVRSNLTMPLRVGGRVPGAIAFGCLRRERDWPAPLVERIGALADVLANALAHKDAQEALDRALAFEQTVSAMLARLLTAQREEQDDLIEAGLGDLARVFGAERATLWQRAGEKAEFVKAYRWVAKGAPVPPDAVGARFTPWVSAQLVAGVPVRFGRHADLPPEAAADLPGLLEHHVRAGVAVPLVVSGAVVGALSFASAREAREWPDALVPRVKLVGEVFASLLARREAERREQEARALAAHAARVGTMGVIAASLVHELTQPVAASLANAETAAELLAAPTLDAEELRATVADIVADDRRAGELIQQLRRFLRRGETERTAVDLREVVDAVLRLVAADAAGKGVEVAVDCAESLPRPAGDRVQLQQVLLNLVLNAIDAVAGNAAGARRVGVRVAAAKTGVRVEVSDNGRGMDEATRSRVFQPFFTTKPGGMGLGLSISRTIAAAHGGALSVDSAPGRGTTFRLELPLQAPEAARPVLPETASAAAGDTVFVIDDDPSMRRALERKLAGAGYRVEPFASAQDYLDRAPPPAGAACIVSDVRMPGLSGLDLQATLARAGRDLPIVFISGHGDVATAAHAMKAGAVDFLTKPFTRAELLAAVAEALARGRAIDAERKERAALQRRYETLTPREREVFGLVAAGLLNKVIGDCLGAAEATVKIHRGRVMEKMNAESVAELVRMAERLGLPSPESVPR